MTKIPKSFVLGGRTWKVKYVAKLPDSRVGDTSEHMAVIRIKKGMTEEETWHTFYHEVGHALCYTLGWKRLNKSEYKIDALGGLLYQFEKTKTM